MNTENISPGTGATNTEKPVGHVNFFSVRFFRAYVVTMRPYLLFVSGITGIAGMSFAEQIPNVQAALIFAASFLSYGFGQALTDCFQTDTDSLSAPYRPLTQGLISRTQVMTVSMLGLTACVLIFGWLCPVNFLLGMIAAFGLATYTYFKRRWWGGPWYNAWIVVVLFVMAYLASHEAADVPFSTIAAGLAIFFGYANFVLSGYFKDIEADRQTGYMTFPVVFGRRMAARMSDVLALLMILAGIAAFADAARTFTHLPFTAVCFISAGVFATVRAQIRLHRVSADSEAHAAIAPVVYGYVLFFSGLADLMKPSWTLPLVCFLVLFAATLALRPARNQI